MITSEFDKLRGLFNALKKYLPLKDLSFTKTLTF